jgi:hypothetical protein
MNPPEHIDQLIQHWTERQAEWSRFRVQVDGATLAGEIVGDLESLAKADGTEELTLTAASALSGYSSDHLSRLIRDGTLPNAGRKGAPRIRRADLPIRPGAGIASVRNKEYSPFTDARSLRVRR